MTREKFLEQRKVIRVACYKEQKYAPAPGAGLAEQLAAREKQKCDFGFERITPLCKNCIWFQVIEVAANGKPLITDHEISREEVVDLALEYAEKNLVDVLPYQQIVQEKNAQKAVDS